MKKKTMMHSCSERRKMIRIKCSLCLIFCLSSSILVIASPAKYLCLPNQKDALWEFKNEFYVPSPVTNLEMLDVRTQKWSNNTDCCSWDGVSCDPKTGKVVELDLEGSGLNGHLRSNSSLFRLHHLQSLHLGDNNISGILPDSIGNLKYLKVLSLFGCKFFGKIPSTLGNLSYLTSLDLSGNFIGELPDSMGNLNQLTELLLRMTNLSGKFPCMLLNLSELTRIDLGGNQFEGMLPSNMSTLSKLEDFDISGNSFSGSIPSSLFMIPSLVSLRVERNHFSGPLEIGNVSSHSQLGVLALGENNFNGPIPGFISKLVGLSSIDLSFWNTGMGTVDFSIFFHLKSLMLLDLAYLNTKSMLDLSIFSPLKTLNILDLSGINLKISSSFHLELIVLILSSCNILEFPKFIQNQTSLQYLDISANQLKAKYQSGYGVCHIWGSNNRFYGEIPTTICELVALDTLVLSNNNFNGSIPQCFKNFNITLSVLHLQNNSLSGIFPEESINDNLRSLDVGHNRLSGELPKSLINCTRLEFLNVEDNIINDTFPFWLRLLPVLQILVLRSNEFHGPISSPGVSLSFPKLRIFDISGNRFSGVLPSDYFAGWSAMSSVVDIVDHTPMRFAGRGSSYYHKAVGLTNKGMNMELVGSGFTIYKIIDVSGNRFEGAIPDSIGLLKELIVLNMSYNAFTGHIPPSLANLTNLQSLDISQNRLSGEIPPVLGQLTFLARMNFSYNRLEGPIPQGTQFESQNSSSFVENPGLCGLPLQKTCGREEGAMQQQDSEKEEEEEQELSWIAAAIGYVPGVVCGVTIGHILTSYKRDWFFRIFH